MTVLSLIQSAARRIGVGRPSVAMTATDATVGLLVELAQEEGKQLARYGDWRVLRKEKTFTTVATEDQSSASPIPTDLDAFIDETFWNRNARRRLYGPFDSEQWQAWKATSTFPILDSFTLRGTSWLMDPIVAAGQTIAYEYRSKNWCQSAGGTAQSAWALDTDTGILSEDLMALGVIWRFRQNRRMEWQTDFDKYVFQVESALAIDRPRKIINLAHGGPIRRFPAIAIPEGSWNVSNP